MHLAPSAVGSTHTNTCYPTQVWGYFSVKSGGGIHEFSDSQFGHLFAKVGAYLLAQLARCFLNA